MNEQQEKLAEHIIQLHKDNNGLFDWTTFYYEQSSQFFPENADSNQIFQQLELVKASLLELDFIEMTNATGDKSILKQPGIAFKGFAQKRADEAKAKREERIKSFPQRYWLLIAAVSYFGGLVSEPLRNYIFPKKTSEEQEQSKPANPKPIYDSSKISDTVPYDSFVKPK